MKGLDQCAEHLETWSVITRVYGSSSSTTLGCSPPMTDHCTAAFKLFSSTCVACFERCCIQLIVLEGLSKNSQPFAEILHL